MPPQPDEGPSDAGPPSSSRVYGRGLWLLGGLALMLRLFDLARRELWVDEGFTWYFARLIGNLELSEKLLRLEATPPLYYALVGAWLKLAGDSDFLLRLPSALFGALSAPLLAVLGDRLGWRRAGMAAGILLACHPWHLFISREARVYPLLLLLVLALAIALWRALEEGTNAAWCRVGVLLLLCLYSHLFGIFVGLAVILLVLVLARDRAGRWRGLAAAAAAFLLFAPYLRVALPALAGSGGNWTQELFFDARPEEGKLARVYEGHLVGARHHLLQRELARPETPPLLRWPALVAQTLLLLAACWRARRPGEERRAVFFLAVLYLLPFVLPWAAGALSGKVLLQPGRQDFLVLGPLCLLLAAGFEKVRQHSKALAWLLVVPILAGGLFRLAWLHVLPGGDSATARGRYLATAAQPDDLAICFGIERLLGERYTRLAGGGLEFASFPAETENHPGWSDPRPLLRRLPQLQAEARTRVLERRGRGRIFTLEQTPPGEAARLPGWEVDELYLRALQEAGWQLESGQPEISVRVWRSP